MAIITIRNVANLDAGFILTPERYNPKRKLVNKCNETYVKLSELAFISNDVVTPTQANYKTFKIINTGNAQGGHIKLDAATENVLGSNKKIVRYGDVIISRLRPYLKQIAYIDKELMEENSHANIVASTEFYILRSKTQKSIAFLVPFLLSERVQSVFANAVEGSQHPRFKEDVLLNLEMPEKLIEIANDYSQSVENDISLIREYEKSISNKISAINKLI